MKGERKKLKGNLNSIQRLLDSIRWQNEIMVSCSSREKFETTIDYINSITTKLREEIEKLPTGHRYTGSFYVRRAYTVPPTSIEVKGSAFMAEDLVSWTLKYEKDIEELKDRLNCPNIYRDSEMSIPIEREEGAAVFEKELELESA